MASHPVLQQSLRGSARDIEPVQFGEAAADAGMFSRLFERIAPIVRGSASVLLLLGIFASGCSAMDPGDIGDASDYSAIGFSTFKGLLREQGSNVKNRVRPLKDLGDEVDLLIVANADQLEASDHDRLLDWVARGNSLILADRPDLLGPSRGQPCTEPLVAASARAGDLGIQLTLEEWTLQHDQRWERLVRCGSNSAIVARLVGSGSIVVVPSADIFRNASMAAADNARVAMALAGWPERVEFVNRFTGAGTRSPYQALSDSPLGPSLLQGLLLLLAFYWYRGARFGRPRDPARGSERSLAEHVEALGLNYRRARASRHVLAEYGGWAIERLKERLSRGRPLGTLDLAEKLASRSQRPRAEIIETLVEAATARDERGKQASGPEDLVVMRNLERLLRETGGAR